MSETEHQALPGGPDPHALARIARGIFRVFRVGLVVVPLVAGGFYLGLGGIGSGSAERSAGGGHAAPETPEIAVEILDSKGEARPAQTGPARVAPLRGEGLRLGGGPLAEVEMRMTDRPLAAILEQYDRELVEKGWRLDEKSTNMIGSRARTGTARVYAREGVYRLLLVGDALDDSAFRPVTLFEGALGHR